jgi:hypothetical protein
MLVVDLTKKHTSQPRPRFLGIWGALDENAAYLVLTKPQMVPDQTSLGAAWSASQTTAQRTLANLLNLNGHHHPVREWNKNCVAETGGVPPYLWDRGHVFWTVRRTAANGGLVDGAWYQAIRNTWLAPTRFSETNHPDVLHPSRPDLGWSSIVVSSLTRLADQGDQFLNQYLPSPPNVALVDWIHGVVKRRIMLSMMAVNSWSFSQEAAERMVVVNERILNLVTKKHHRLTSLCSSTSDPSLLLAALAPAPPEQVIVDQCRLLAVVARPLDPVSVSGVPASPRRVRTI